MPQIHPRRTRRTLLATIGALAVSAAIGIASLASAADEPFMSARIISALDIDFHNLRGRDAGKQHNHQRRSHQNTKTRNKMALLRVFVISWLHLI